jgi:hypothetical protein
VVPPGQDSNLHLEGPLLVTGPVGDGQVRDLALDLKLDAVWREGWRATPAQNCIPAHFATLDVAGFAFQNGAFNLCALNNGPLMATDAQHRLSGGFFLDDLSLAGRLTGEERQTARLSTRRIEGRFGGTSENGLLNISIAAPRLAIQMARDRLLNLDLQAATAQARFGNNTWRVDGAFQAGALADPTLPGTVSAIAGRWSMAPEQNGDALIRVAAGAARVDAVPAQDSRPLFQPIRLEGVEALLRNGVIDANGRILLNEDGRQIASFTAEHHIDEGAGQAHLAAPTITFDESFQPYRLSELARGVAADVRGPASATADVHWTKETMTAEARLKLDSVSLASATLPVINDVRGEVHFDDLFTMTTPPGQELAIGELNPGIAVHNGRVRFQILSPQQVALEAAAFQFASGVLSVRPTTITLGAEQTPLQLDLRGIDVADLIEQLQIKDLAATGTVEGSFPILLTSRTALIQNGELRTSAGGGTIAYTGNAGDSMQGAARMAFQALTNFHYDNLTLSLNGDLNGEIVSAISFSGRNNAPTQLGEGSPIPGLGNVRIAGVPFAFNVRVTAPFRSLADTAAGLSDARTAIDSALQNQTPPEQENHSVDVQTAPLR